MADESTRKALIDTGSDDAVTVNTRALIDKILARYAAEFTVFRELLQNADDAGATCCQLRFESIGYESEARSSSSSSSSSAPDLKAILKSWTFKNDGKVFGSDDWARLRRIAEGNPDPDRIGAFGVGFYSLFSICEEPVVVSGDELMGFFWKNGGDSLFTRRAKNPNASSDHSPSGNPWTSFYMALREPSAFPESPLQLARFLATSLTFTTQVRSIELWFDDHRLCKLDKTLEAVRPITMPSHLNAYSPEKMMKVARLESQNMQITVEALGLVWEGEREKILAEKKAAMRPSLTAALTKSGGLSSMLQSAFGGRSRDRTAPSTPQPEPPQEGPLDRQARLLTVHSAKALLKVASSHVDVKTDAQFKREIERSTKKPPPTKTSFNLIWVGKEEYDASDMHNEDSEEQVGPKIIFDGLMPKLGKQGNVFIGFRTHQTTGFAGHVAARFIPTVERESIDFIDRHCARWNMELLAVGGYTCRAIFETEMEYLRKAWTDKEDEDGRSVRDRLLAKALHTMRFFTMHDSSPSPRVSATTLTTFFNASRQALITIASTRGIRSSSSVRLPNAVLLEFMRQLPVIPTNHVEEAPLFIEQVRSRNLVKEITMEDVFSELGSRALEVDEMISCLRWWVNVSQHPGYDTRLRKRLLDSTILSLKTGEDAKSQTFQPLSSVGYFLNPQRLPSDVPLPPSCLAYDVSKAFTPSELSKTYDWSELSIPAWLSHLATLSAQTDTPSEVNLQLSPAFSEKVFGIVARSWGNLSASQQEQSATVLGGLSCVPTKKGMQRPDQAYFSNVSLFDDLPIVEFPATSVKGNLEKVLVALKIRRHVDLQLIFTRLVGGGDWSHVELLTYLASNRESLSSVEIDRLRKTPIWPKEGEEGPPGKDGKPKTVRYRASQLYEPLDSLRDLGLPILDWKTKGVVKPWRATSEEAKFASELGLLKHPPVEKVLELASTEDENTRTKALAYFLEKPTYRKTYTLAIGQNYAFVPCKVYAEGKTPSAGRLKPTDVFTNSAVQSMLFPTVAGILPTDIPKLQLRSDPPPGMLISRLVNDPPKTLDKAKEIYEYLASVMTSFSSHDVSILRQAAIVPIASSKKDATVKAADNVRLVPPGQCYFGSNNTVEAFRSVFLYVPDLGPQANSFLRLVGVSDEPSIEEVAGRLVAEPARFYDLSGSIEAYLSLLRQIATNWSRIRSPLRAAMKQSAFLLGSKRVKNGGPASAATSTDTKKSRDLLTDSLSDDEDDNEDAGMLVHSLKRPGEVVIMDDANAGMIFGSSLFFAPHEDLLEQSLYAQLGSPRLSTLVEETYVKAGQVASDTRRTEEVKALVLERTPLFLFETRQSGNKSDIRRDAEWLKGALQVLEVGGEGLRLSRTLRFGATRVQDSQRSSAMAEMEGRTLKLYIAGTMSIDWFEVAAALNKFLLSRQRLQEVLLFMTLLSTSLRDLKRRGFHVDKILQQRKAEREAYEREKLEHQRQAQLEALKAPSEKQIEDWKSQVMNVFPDAEPSFVETMLKGQKDHHLENTTNAMLQDGYPKRQGRKAFADAEGDDGGMPGQFNDAFSPSSGQMTRKGSSQSSSGGGGLFSSFRDRFKRPDGLSSLASGTSSIARPPAITAAGRSASGQISEIESGSGGGNGGSVTRGGGIGNKAAEQPSSLDAIRRNVLSAISASRPDSSTSVHSQSQMSSVKEAANGSYCDNTGVDADLRLAGEVSGMRVFVSSDLDAATTLPSHAAALDRLINQIYRPVGSIFGLDPQAMHVFVDVKGPTIAFNRGGTIWLNLRYYLAWFDDEVQAGRKTDALISVFFSVAHEIAHNVEQQHNAQHEFYTSALCEHFFMSLANYIATTLR